MGWEDAMRSREPPLTPPRGGEDAMRREALNIFAFMLQKML